MLLSEGRSRQEEYDSRKNPAIVEHRAGRLKISKPALESRELPEVLAILKFIPARAEFMCMSGVLELDGFSPFFDKGRQDEVTPDYEVQVTGDYGRVDSLALRRGFTGEFKTIYTGP